MTMSCAMTVYLVRHAIAEPRGPVWPDDTERPLTARGTARMRAIAERLADRGVQVDRIVSSPLLRARQTADILRGLWLDDPRSADRPGDLVEALAPGHDPAETAAALAALGAIRRLAVVGHEPGLGELAAWLTGRRTPLAFKKGGVARIDVPHGLTAGAGSLAWLVTPKLVLEE